MGFLDTFKGNQYKAELAELQQKYNDLQELLTPEMQNALMLKDTIRELNNNMRQKQDELLNLNQSFQKETEKIEKERLKRQKEIDKLNQEINCKKKKLLLLMMKFLFKNLVFTNQPMNLLMLLIIKKNLPKFVLNRKI